MFSIALCSCVTVAATRDSLHCVISNSFTCLTSASIVQSLIIDSSSKTRSMVSLSGAESSGIESSWPINSFNRMASFSIRSSSLLLPFWRASSSAICNRARGDRNSCEISRTRRFWFSILFSSAVAMSLKSNPNCDNSSFLLKLDSVARALKSPLANARVAMLSCWMFRVR